MMTEGDLQMTAENLTADEETERVMTRYVVLNHSLGTSWLNNLNVFSQWRNGHLIHQY
jgi:hypothetical protein